jgi:hypothetical protein
MELIKKHYEKVILGIVLVGLAAAAALLPLKVARLQTDLESAQNVLLNNPNPNRLKPLDMTNHVALLERAQSFQGIQLALPHHLFNPVIWERRPGGALVKRTTPSDTGAQALQIVRLTPLYFEVSLAGGDDSGRFQVASVRQTERNASPRSRLLRVGERSEQFFLKEVGGEPGDPELVIELLDVKKTITISKGKPYQQIIGYSADLVYPPDKNRAYLKQRKDDKLTLSRTVYKIIEINENEVVLSEEPSGKRTIISARNPNN